ncbi:mandelate racemase/muconate lactonizing enzyme family protein [Limnofasciculus baicalensis]|uniref:Mandelate racemase/muconate lactonizing enzyme C-terminal domain-containing protein n=1 Tax=Limnofasciculus baicalensis BBK-W-15 TaxID=2699891 RepID=A0AAE3GW34_9CYAN|nr:enolase C-terminal domain-like protein [Limnofasciculus baicalensis]MCP2731112.1 hypothetical protein [Limnofasciculus baicalensis BBK-W-15]
MKIIALEIWPIKIPYKKSYSTSRGTISHGDHVVIKLITDEGITGAGEASFIHADRAGETIETVTEILHKRLGPILMGFDPFDVELIMKTIDKRVGEDFAFSYSRCAIDLALYDIMGKALNLPVAKLIGGTYRTHMEVSRSLSIKPLSEIAGDAEKLRDMGYKMLTLKGSKDWQGDIKRFIAVRKALGDDFPLEIDPNQAYTVKQAIRLIRALEDYGLENLEQPCAWWDLDGMAQVTSVSPVPITADESVINPADAIKVVKMRAADMITIKLARLGGFHYGRKVAAIAEAGGLACNMGSKHTFGVGTAAIIHFCAAHSIVIEPLGYGSPLERFTDDIIVETIPFKEGIVSLPEGSGLGVTLDETKLKKYSDGSPLVVKS